MTGIRHYLLIPLLLLQAAGVLGQSLDAKQLDSLQEQLQQESGLGDEVRSQYQLQLDSARQLLDEAADNTASASELQASAEAAPRELERLQRELEASRNSSWKAEELAPEGSSLEQLESELSVLEASRMSLAKRRDELRALFDQWPQQREAALERMVVLKGRIDENQGALSAAAETLEQRISKALIQARVSAWQAEQQQLEAELLTRPARLEIRSAESANVAHNLDVTDQKLKVLRAAVEAARTNAAEQKLETTAALQEKITSMAPQLQEYASQNRELAEQAKNRAAQNDEAVSAGNDMQLQFESMEADYSLMRRRLEVAGRKEILGRVMIQKLDSLPNTDLIKRQIRANNDRVAGLSLVYIDTDEELRQVISRREHSEQLLSAVDANDKRAIALVEEMVEQRRQLMESDRKNLRDLLQNLLNNNETAGNLILVADSYHRFLVGNLMWVRNFNFLSPETLARQVAGFVSPADWRALPSDLVRGYHSHTWSETMLLLLFLLVVLRRSLKSLYQERLGKPALLVADTLLNIILCLGLASLLVLPWPFALYIAGQLIAALPDGKPFHEALAPALFFVASGLYALLLAKELLSPMGIGRRFLKWDTRMLVALRREVRWSGPLILAAMLLDIFVLKLDVVSSGGPLGAITTATVAVSIIIACVRLLRDPLFHDSRNLRLFLRLCIILPIITLIMLALGLLFAAEIYLGAICLSILLVFAIKTVSDVLERALLILRARLERKARQELRAREAEGDEADLEVENLVDVISLSEAHDKLLMLVRLVALGTGLWLIWSPGLPAFNLLESIPLWQVGDSSDPTGALRTITLMDLAMGVFIIVITTVVAKHLPSLVTVFLLEWVDISDGARYASSILMQYIVVAIGASMFLARVGWDWSQLQWLVAALGVGIGFGLQEIVANFISGIIILFERPVRVGDIISAGGAEGKVKSISARATVLQTFEGKEHLIPNKELITGQVINWSLSENAVRVVIPVGVAYGTDVRQALDLLLDAAREVSLVLTEPEPMATFEDFGDNSLLLWLRCYVSEERPRAWTELRMLINDKFSAAGIVISFPQRDLHLDTLKPLEIRLASDRD